MIKNYKKYFVGKKITVMGLGLLGRGIGVTKFLAECGADLIVTDLKSKEQLASALKQLAKYPKIKYVFGEHRLEDFSGRDLIIKAAGVPLNSPFIAEAKKNKIPVEMDASLFAKIAMPMGVKIIGVTGTRGKSTVTHLLYEILKLAEGKNFGKVYLGGNVRGLATLPLVKKVNPPSANWRRLGDVVLMELDSWQLQGFGDAKISPNISVFTNLLVDHQNYYGSTALTTGQNPMEMYFADKANIYRYQKEGDLIIAGKEISNRIKADKLKSNLKVVSAKNFPSAGGRGWKTKLIGEHNLFNSVLAIEAARALGLSDNLIKKAVANFSGVPGRLELVREVGGVKYYNDTTATTPDGVIAALSALKKYQGKIILLGGGADKELDYKKYAPVVKKSVKSLALFQGKATDKIMKTLGPSSSLRVSKTKFPVKVFDNMKEAFIWSKSQAKKGDIVLLSPGAASFGVFKNEFDRGDQFVKLVSSI